MTVKTIRWFEVPKGILAAFRNPSPPGENPTRGFYVVCLEYKDYDNRKTGVQPWFLTHEINIIPLISEWGTEPRCVRLLTGAQEMVDRAASDEVHGFKDGDFYGIYCVDREDEQVPVSVGMVYANSKFPLIPVARGVAEIPALEDSVTYAWVNHQFTIPLRVEVQMPSERPVVVPRISRYRRTLVI